MSDPRNSLGGPLERRFRQYVAAVITLGVGLVAFSVAWLTPHDLSHLGPAFGVVAVLLALCELRPMYIAGARDQNGLVMSTSFVFALLLRYDLAIALAMQTLAVVLVDTAKRKAPWRIGFNVGQYALSWAGAEGALWLLGRTGSPEHPLHLHAGDLLPIVAAAAVFFVLNELLVAQAVALRSGTRIRDVLREDLGYQFLTGGSLLALAPLIVLCMQAGPAFVPLLVPPLLAVYVVASMALDREREVQTDPLTGLGNRTRLQRAAAEALADSETNALVLLDLDRFKEVNDTLGHHVGDQLLAAVAERLLAATREQDTVVRLGGDEFAVLMPEATVHDARGACLRVREVLAQPFTLGGLLVEVSASAGVAVAPEHGSTVDDLMQHADVAMYLSKDSGEVELYDADRDLNSPERLVLLGELRRAIENDELVLHFQPKSDLRTGAIVGVEALVRWVHPERGTVPPDEFVPLAERSGLVTALTAWVLDRALAQAARWRDEGLELEMAVNVSVKDLCGDKLVEDVARGLLRHRLPASALVLEVTEGSLFADPGRATTTLVQLQHLGVALSIDDFGTGWSSLTQLRHLPVSEVKIDRTFVAKMGTDPRDLAIVRSVVDLARGLGMRVVAEGVEDQGTARLLGDLLCDRAQGWWLSKALDARELTPWLQSRRPVPSDRDRAHDRSDAREVREPQHL